MCNYMAFEQWAKLMECDEMEDWSAWLAPSGPSANMGRPPLPTSVADNVVNMEEEKTAAPQICAMWAVGIAQDEAVVIYRVMTNGIMANSSVNMCMADS